MFDITTLMTASLIALPLSGLLLLPYAVERITQSEQAYAENLVNRQAIPISNKNLRTPYRRR